MEGRREGRRKVVVSGRRWGRGRGTVTSLCLLSVGGPAGGGNTKHQQTDQNKRPVQKALRGHTPLSSIRKMTETYLKAEKDGALCSVSSPKPSSDLKNKMLTPTILRTLCHLNDMKMKMKLLSSIPLHDSPCFPCLLYLPSAVKQHV